MAITPAFTRVPRYIFAIISEIMCVVVCWMYTLDLKNSTDSYHWQSLALRNSTVPSLTSWVRPWIHLQPFLSVECASLGVIGYWSTSFGAIVLIEHFIFRSSFQGYDVERWDNSRLLPPGIAAVLAFLGSFGIIIPSMQQTWYTGPIANAGTGDIGVFTGATVAVLLYTPLRAFERRIWPGR